MKIALIILIIYTLSVVGNIIFMTLYYYHPKGQGVYYKREVEESELWVSLIPLLNMVFLLIYIATGWKYKYR